MMILEKRFRKNGKVLATGPRLKGVEAGWQFRARLANVSTYRFDKKMLGGDSSVFYLNLIIVRLI